MNVEIDFKISAAATGEFKRLLKESEAGPTALVRISTQGGCGGSYGLGFVLPDEVDPARDIVEDHGGLKVVVDKKSLLQLDGVSVDWVEENNQKGFRFNSSNSGGSCGCSKKKCCNN